MTRSTNVSILTKSNSCSHKDCLIQPTYNDHLINVKKPSGYIPQEKTEYLKIENFFSEYTSEADKLRARVNLGIEGLAYWGNIQGYIEDQSDLIEYIKTNNQELVEVLQTSIQQQIREASEKINYDLKNPDFNLNEDFNDAVNAVLSGKSLTSASSYSIR